MVHAGSVRREKMWDDNKQRNVVVIVGGFRLPSGNASAVRCVGNARLFQKMGYEVVIIGKIEKKYKKENTSWYEWFGFPCLDIEISTRSIEYQICFMECLKEYVEITSIYAVIAYNYPGIALNMLRRWCNNFGCHMISDTTEWHALEGKNPIFAILRKMSTEFRMRYVNGKIGNIICSSRYIRDYYRRHYKNINTVLIPMIDETSFTEFSEKKISMKKVHYPRRFIYAGSPGLNFSKDSIRTIVEAFVRLGELPYVLDFYGFTRDTYISVYPQDIEILDRNEKIRFHGRIPHDEMIKELEDADFYVLYRPDTKVNRVGFSTKSMEAVSHGVPLIANDVNGDFALYFDESQAFICGVDDFGAFVDNIKKAITISEKDVYMMKQSCRSDNPFLYSKFIDPVRDFMAVLK